MKRLCLFLAVLPLGAGLDLQAEEPNYRPAIQTLAKQGRGTPEGRAAWDQVSQAGPAVLPLLLDAMNTDDTVALNWLRTAFDRVAERAGKQVALKDLLAAAQDAKRPGKTRRLALEWAEHTQPGVSKPLLETWLNDPEFRFEAVAARLQLAKTISAQPTALRMYREAFEASRDVVQAREAAAGLENLGAKVSVGEHFGFLLDWYLIGPFDAHGKKSFTTEYPPEKKVDLKQELPGQGKTVRWIRHTVKEPPHRSGAKHQALVSLREKSTLGDADDAVAFAYTEFTLDKAQQVEFRGSADDHFTVWVNGKREFGFEEYENGVRLDRHRFPVQLREGKNTVLVKIAQSPPPTAAPNWEFFLRVCDATGKGIAMKCTFP